MNVLLVEPFLSGSHQTWAKSYQHCSQHNVDILALPGRHWKWRMHGGAVSLAQQFLKQAKQTDLILATDMLDLAVFLGLSRAKSVNLPTVLYFHENQISYPWSPTDQDAKLGRNNHYGFINYTSALSASAIFFNSSYHQNSFLQGLKPFLQQFPDHQELSTIAAISGKAKVLPLGMNLKKFDTFRTVPSPGPARILWNHRWEYDKNPTEFFQVLFRLKAEGIAFEVIILGAAYKKQPPIFAEAAKKLADRILHMGFAEDFASYAKYLWQSDILPVTGKQDFFGGSVVEAMYCNCFPLLPHRLAYPEHIPSAFHSQHLYENSAAYYTQLKSAILSVEEIRKSIFVQNFVKHYDWSILAPTYDQSLQAIVEKTSK
ncbi:MAG: DUF3524 domain-containing protein [Saprospiraceae bacterium]